MGWQREALHVAVPLRKGLAARNRASWLDYHVAPQAASVSEQCKVKEADEPWRDPR